MDKKTTLLLFLLITSMFYAQNMAPKYVREANTLFESGMYHQAIDKCQTAFTRLGSKGSLKQKGDMAFKIAESYNLIQRYELANEWLDVCVELKYFDVNPDIYFLKGESLRKMGDYAKAEKSYSEFKKIANGSRADEVATALASCEKYKFYDMMEPEINYEVKCETKINRKEMDWAPAFADKKGLKIYFSSTREESFGSRQDGITGEKYADIYVAEFDKNGDPTNVASIDEDGVVNTSHNEGSLCFDKKFKKMFFTRCYDKDALQLGCDIWSVKLVDGAFVEPVKMNLKRNETVSVGHPCLTHDGLMLIFASDMKSSGGDESFGGRDLWYINYNKKAKTWDSIPKNMGSKYNTAGNELFPTIGLHGEFFFASDGHKGIGGLDIFMCNLGEEKNTWGDVTNMGYPINSPSNDYAITSRGKKGYFTSERRLSNEQMSPDVWSYSVPPNLYDVKVIVHEFGNKNERIIEAEVSFNGTDDSEWTGPTNEMGITIKYDVKNGKQRYINEDVTYSINAMKEGYLQNPNSTKITTVGLKESQSFIVEIELVPIVEEIRTPEIRYPLNEWTFINDETCMSTDSLEFLYNLLITHPYITIDLFSHTDSRSSAQYNQVLSENRAKAVYKFLVEEKGIDARRIQPIGKGEAEPAKWINEAGDEIVLNESFINKFRRSDNVKFEKLNQINRRTTARITSTEFDPATAVPANSDWMEFKPLK
ncbi:MAG: OmpA family protein [Crocinitomicaceae bacterium]